MKRIISGILFIGVFLALASTAGTAHADSTGNETCGGQALGTYFSYNWWAPSDWQANVKWNCGTDKTFTWEIQHTTDGGQTIGDWWGSGNELGHRSPAGCNTGFTCNAWMDRTGSCANTGSYKVRVNSNGYVWSSAWYGAGQVCPGNQEIYIG